MAKKKEITNLSLETEDNKALTVIEDPIDTLEKLYKYDIGQEVFLMQNNKVNSFIIEKRVIVTRKNAEGGKIITKVYYDPYGNDSMRATFIEDILYPSKEALLNSL